MATMLLGGLWHGAAWTFVIWGALHGVVLAGTHALRQAAPGAAAAIPRWVGVVVTFHFVTFAWIFFRAQNIATVNRVLAGLWNFSAADFAGFAERHVFELLLLAIFALGHRYDRHAGIRLAVRRWNKGIIWAIIVTMVVLAIAVSQGSSGKFIYFDF
jgi:alginate O-acetyltransferase complex protein AlgI